MFSFFMVLLLTRSPFNDDFAIHSINDNQNNLIQDYQSVFVFNLIVEHLFSYLVDNVFGSLSI
jgi:hypothetical protein